VAVSRRGISTGNSSKVSAALLSKSAPGLSASTVVLARHLVSEILLFAIDARGQEKPRTLPVREIIERRTQRKQFKKGKTTSSRRWIVDGIRDPAWETFVTCVVKGFCVGGSR
jgi:hypothetical protein